MSRYAFAIHTKPVTEDDYFYLTDKLRLRRYNEWIGEEEIAQESFGVEDAEAVMRSLHLVKKVAADSGLPEDSVWEQFRTNSQSQNLLLFASYPEEFTEVMRSGKRTPKEQRLITVFMKTRGEVLIDNQWTAIRDYLGWNDEDSGALGRELINKLLEFINREANGGKEPEPVDLEELDEGKSPSPASKKEPAKRSQRGKTGTRSSGNSKPSETSDSTGETLPASA